MKYVLMLMLLPVGAFAEALDVTSEKLEIDQNTGHAVFSGNVHAVRGGLTMNSARADVTYGTGKGSDIEQVLATGSVVINRASGDTAKGDQAVYTPATGKLVLTGGVVELTRGGHTVQGTRLDYDTAVGQAVMQGGSAGVHAHFQSGAK